MSAASADRTTKQYGERKVRQHDVAATTTIYGGTLVAIDASGNAKPAANTAGLRLAGVSRQDPINGIPTANNATGSAGDRKVEVYTDGCFEFTCSGLTKADIGKPVYVTDDQTVTLTPSYMFAGILVDFDGATKAVVDIEPATKGGVGGARAGKLFPMVFTSNATVTGAVQSKMEFPFAVSPKRIYADVLTAPGGSDTATCTITDGASPVAVVITGSAVQNEDEALAVNWPANTDISVTFARTGSTAATMTVVLWLERL